MRWIEGIAEKGLQRTSWDLRYSAPDPIDFRKPDFTPPWVGEPQGPLAAPGTYSVTLYVLHEGVLEAQGTVMLRSFLIYEQFDPRPFPSLMASYERKTIIMAALLAYTGGE